MNTTLHNHAAAGTKEKPLIPNIIFKSLIWLKENRFEDETQYLLQSYSLTPYQKQFIEGLNAISRTNVENIGKS